MLKPTKRIRVEYDLADIGRTARAAQSVLADWTLNPERTIYLYAGHLCRITKGNIDLLCLKKLHCELTDRIEFFTSRPSGDFPVATPRTITDYLFYCCGEGWPSLDGVTSVPYLLADGSILEDTGYYAATKYLFLKSAAEYEIPESPTKSQAQSALNKLNKLLSEFKFFQGTDRAAAIALLLTAVSRRSYLLAPQFVVSSNQIGAGKGTLIKVASALASGDQAPGFSQWRHTPDQLQNQIMAQLISGASEIHFDNVRGSIGSTCLESLVTSGKYTDRIVGKSQNVTVPARVLLTFNGNNLQISPDQVRRSVLINLDMGDIDPALRTFSRDVVQYTLDNRDDLVSAALTIQSAFLRLVRKPDSTPLHGFPEWDYFVRRPMLWLEELDPVGKRAPGTTRGQDLAAFLRCWYRDFGPRPVLAAEVVNNVELMEQAKASFGHVYIWDDMSTRALGQFLAGRWGNAAGGYRLERGRKFHNRYKWYVSKVC
jgi:hypothetical protein